MLIFNQRELKDTRRTLRRRQTPSEAILWEELRDSRLGIKFRRQFGILRYIVDFYAPYARLAIEIDGLIHLDSEVRARDVERQKDIEALGITILRFTNEQITGNMDDVLRSIRISLQNPLLAKERAG